MSFFNIIFGMIKITNFDAEVKFKINEMIKLNEIN